MMAAHLKYWLSEPKLHLLRKSWSIFSEKTIKFHSRCRTLDSSLILKRHESTSDKASANSRECSNYNIDDASSQIDQHFIDKLYKKSIEDNLKNVSGNSLNPLDRTEYFKQAWQTKLDAMTQKKASRTVCKSDNSPIESRIPSHGQSGNSLWTLRDPNERMAEKYPEDKDDERDWRKGIPLTRYGRIGRKAVYYTRKITQLGREGKINEAMQVFDDWMMTQDRVLPSKRTFVTLIGIVGRAGYTRKAFQLFRQMKNLGLDPPDHVYTSLFNSCANCPLSDYGLKHANSLYEQMHLKGIPMSPITVKACMKAFALCGDFPRAFQILDEARIPLDGQCINSLLIACAMDKQSGFRKALKVWHRMRELNIKPEYQTHNLMLRCVRDCGVGDVTTLASDLGLGQGQTDVLPLDYFTASENDRAYLTTGFQKIEQGDERKCFKDERKTVNQQSNFRVLLKPQAPYLEKIPVQDKKSLVEKLSEEVDKAAETDLHFRDANLSNSTSASGVSRELEWWEDSNHALEREKTYPRLLHKNDNSKSTQVSSVEPELSEDSIFPIPKSVSLLDLETRAGRLVLVGGVTRFISHMKQHGIQPDITTFTQLLSCVPSNDESEAMLLKMMEDMGVAVDIDFLNDVMMRRNKRHDSPSAKDVLVLISRLRLTPNMRTYATMALTCHNLKDAQVLLDNMKSANVEPNVEVMGHLIYISRQNFVYKRRLLEMVEEMALRPNRRTIETIENSIAIAKRRIVEAERKEDRDNFVLSPRFQSGFKGFLRFYESWLKRTELREEKHPWERFNDVDKSVAQSVQTG